MGEFKYKSLDELVARFREAERTDKSEQRETRILTEAQREAQKERIRRYKQTEKGRLARRESQRRRRAKRRESQSASLADIKTKG
ncbi:MAG: hypothetical protein LBI57_03350 [Helicobacteraceae bacterium]|jgi:hypothetical protein|nr:hypothetical protein [Helicobacteraceae bacterium]